jgi:hypothetical protein
LVWPQCLLATQAGATFTGSFTLPAKSGAGWITVRTSAPDSSLPPYGTRITPAYAPVLPLLSSTGYTTYVSYLWGLTGDIPETGDFDGDRNADFAIYRPSSGGWYILQSSTSYSTFVSHLWGLGGDIPLLERP